MNKKIDLTVLLKDCPSGMELDCLMYEDVYFDYVDERNIIHCYIQHETHKTSITFNQYGTHNSDVKSKCVIFPKGKTTWEGFQMPFVDGDFVVANNVQIFILKKIKNVDEYDLQGECYIGYDYKDCEIYSKGIWWFNRHANEEEKQQLINTLKKNGYEWDTEKKELKKIEHKFDITTLKPFDKVLVRDNNTSIWINAFFGFYDIEITKKYPFVASAINWTQCIPYEGNEHLLGTDDDCDEYYKNW
jgi:hypothetical protein